MYKIKKNNIILTGMPAVGKSTAGVLLAKKSGLSFIDTDLYIQQKEKAKLTEIIKKHGTDGFIEIESRCIREISEINCVIATGGSAVYSSSAMNHLKKNGICVFLSIDPEKLKERIVNFSQRGVVKKRGQDIFSLLAERKKLYNSYADIIIETTDYSPHETVEIIYSALKEKYELDFY